MDRLPLMQCCLNQSIRLEGVPASMNIFTTLVVIKILSHQYCIMECLQAVVGCSCCEERSAGAKWGKSTDGGYTANQKICNASMISITSPWFVSTSLFVWLWKQELLQNNDCTEAAKCLCNSTLSPCLGQEWWRCDDSNESTPWHFQGWHTEILDERNAKFDVRPNKPKYAKHLVNEIAASWHIIPFMCKNSIYESHARIWYAFISCDLVQRMEKEEEASHTRLMRGI